MRELKFRAFYDGMMIQDAARVNNALYWKNKGYQCFNLCAFSQEDPAELMQYIGLKDKNGKEIYEGDIVRFWFVGDEFIRLVEWSVPQAGFVAGFSVDLGKVDGTSAVEVIGNIYENPELIR